MLSLALSITSSIYTPAAIETLWFTPHTSYNNSFNQSIEKNKLLTSHEIVLWLRKEGLPISIIAEIVRVERKTIYSWLQHGEMRAHNQERLRQLYDLIAWNKQSNLNSLYRFWSRELKGGTSLGNLLKEEFLDVYLIQQALQELWPLAKKHHDLAIHNPKNKFGHNPFLEDVPEVF